MDGIARQDVVCWRRRFTDALLGTDAAVQSAFNAPAG